MDYEKELETLAKYSNFILFYYLYHASFVGRVAQSI